MILNKLLALVCTSILAIASANAQSCYVKTKVTGEPCLGGYIDMELCSGPSCFVCVFVSPNPGPTNFIGLVWNVGLPVLDLVKDQIPPTGQCVTRHFPIPADPKLAGLTLYYQSFGSDASHAIVMSDYGNFTIGSSSIGDTIFCDDNNNGTQDPTEAGIANVTVNLSCNGKVTGTTTTDSNGKYLFSKLPQGECSVEVDLNTVPSGKTTSLACSPKQTVNLPCGQSNHDVDFCFVKCNPCKDKVTKLMLQYNGSVMGAEIEVKQGRRVIYKQKHNTGDSFLITGTDPKGTFGPEIKIKINGGGEVKMHTSCSVPVGPGFKVGEFEVLAGESLNGGPLCPVTGGGGSNLCTKGMRVNSLTMEYTGESCAASKTTQDPAKLFCSGDPALAPVVTVRVSDNADPNNSSANVWFTGSVNLNSVFVVGAPSGKTFSTETHVHIYDQSGALIQQLEFHTSCSQPIAIDDQFGSLKILGLTVAPKV